MTANTLEFTYESIATSNVHIVDITVRTPDDMTVVGLLALSLEQWRRKGAEYVAITTTGDNDLVWLLDRVGFEVLEAPTNDDDDHLKALYDFDDESPTAAVQREALVEMGYNDPAARLAGIEPSQSSA
jgi:hypothetical protein